MGLALIFNIYQLNFSQRVRIQKNMEDFQRVKSFTSSEVSQVDIDKIYRAGNTYSFTIGTKEISNFQKIGKVDMYDKNGDRFNSFILFKDHEEYLVYIRNLYMSIDK